MFASNRSEWRMIYPYTFERDSSWREANHFSSVLNSSALPQQYMNEATCRILFNSEIISQRGGKIQQVGVV